MFPILFVRSFCRYSKARCFGKFLISFVLSVDILRLLVPASFLIRSVNILRFVGLWRSFPCSFVRSVDILRLLGSASFLVRAVNIPRLVGSASFIVRSVTIRSLLD